VRTENCCFISGEKTTEEDLPQAIKSKVRFLSDNNHAILEMFIKSAISDHDSQTTSEFLMLFDIK